ncbi:hypothetical protein H6H01_03245 [Nostoc calcicola FACHB-3891]|nr:hypothetical protein [Nostoc calcicola FACHB-3891]
MSKNTSVILIPEFYSLKVIDSKIWQVILQRQLNKDYFLQLDFFEENLFLLGEYSQQLVASSVKTIEGLTAHLR